MFLAAAWSNSRRPMPGYTTGNFDEHPSRPGRPQQRDNLARRDLPVTAHRLTADTSNIHNTILSLAADNDSVLIVMGGYGHSRLREFILGGVTRGMFETLTVPTLFSH
mgnify:CR=1 FL=1